MDARKIDRVLRAGVAACAMMVVAAISTPAQAQTFGMDFDSDYTFVSLGSPGDVPTNLGGITFLDNDTLLIGGAANVSAGAIYQVDVVRDAGNHITGFAGPGTVFSTAPNIDGGLLFHPDTGVLLYAGYSNNILGQILPGSTEPDKIIDLSALGIASSVGALAFVPDGFAGAGQFKVASYNQSLWYTATLTPDGMGTFDIGSVSPSVPVTGGPEGIVYIRGGSTGFANDSVLIAEWSAGRVGAYEIDANGDPILATRRDFMSSLSGAEGAVIDPLTGDFLFSTFGGGNQVLVVSGFDVPATLGTDPDDGGKINFGYVRIGETKSMELTVTNVGGVGSTLTGAIEAATGDFSGPDPDDAISLISGDSVLKSFTYSPNTAGFMQDSITVDTNGGTHTIGLQGIGVGPVLDAAANPIGTTLDAGLAVGPGAMGIIEIVLDNTFVGGDAIGDDTLTALSLLDFSFTGPDAGLFTLLTPLAEIMAGESLTLQIKFNPATDGTFNATFNLLTDLGAGYGEAGMALTWNLIGAADNVPVPAMLGPASLVAVGLCMRRRRR